MKTETERIAQLARAYGVQCIGASRGVSSYKDQSVALENLLAAIDSLIADRATLAEGVRDLVGCSAVRLDGIHAIQTAIAVAERLKAASEPAEPAHNATPLADGDPPEPPWLPGPAPSPPAKPPVSVPAATDTGEVKPPAMRVWYENGRYFVECEGSVLSLGPKHKDPSAYAIYVPGPATGGPKSAEYAEPAKPEPTDLRTLVEGMNHCIDAAIGSLIGAARDKNLLTIDALRAIARVVEELAKEANP